MNNPIRIAVDAMGGENSPLKVIRGIEIHYKNTNNIYYNIFGNKEIILPILNKTKIKDQAYKIIHTENSINDEDSPLTAAKKGKILVCGYQLKS